MLSLWITTLSYDVKSGHFRLFISFFFHRSTAAGGRKDFDVGSQAHTCDRAAGLPGAPRHWIQGTEAAQVAMG